jgi:hypothetical protein
MSQIDKKTAIEHVNDFFEDIYDTAIKAPISFGDFLARVWLLGNIWEKCDKEI